ncbi:MAG: GntR family transcriptional regulator [Sphaerochaetaceae bacterium]
MPFVVYDIRQEHETAKQYAYRTIRRNIMFLDMLPGEAVLEKEMAGSMGVSRTPVREALLELEHERLIDIFPQRGTRVSLLDGNMVDQGRFLRSTVEMAVLEIDCANVPTQKFLDDLDLNLKEQAELAATKNLHGFFAKDSEFHKILFTAAGKEMVYDLISVYIPHFHRERMLRLQMFDPTELLHDHMQITQSIRNKDCRSAQLYMKRHLDRVICDQKILKEAFPAYFSLG